MVWLKNVTKDYSADGQLVRAVDGVTLTAEAGEFVAVVGRSGCGKSTLLNLAGAMDFPTSGEVLLDGVNTRELDDRKLTRLRREKVGFVFQSFQLLSTLSVVENVELPLLLAGARGARTTAIERLESVELAGFENRMPHQLSGGEMQRAAIARALVNRPRVLLADEPTGNLDENSAHQVADLLLDLNRRQGLTLLLVTHNPQLAARMNRNFVLEHGRLRSATVSRANA